MTMKKFIQKNEPLFVILLIIFYILSNSIILNNFGNFSIINAIWNILISVIIILVLITNKLHKEYGLVKFKPTKEVLFFIPLIIIMTFNLWGGININNSPKEIIYYILSMIGIGFLEEIIFRGFLYKMMAKDNVKSAIIVSSLTFGIGHIINLFNGADFIMTIIQIIGATAIGFLFVILFIKTNSIWPCVITHIVINSTSIFSVDNVFTKYVTPFIMIVIAILYCLYILKKDKN